MVKKQQKKYGPGGKYYRKRIKRPDGKWEDVYGLTQTELSEKVTVRQAQLAAEAAVTGDEEIVLNARDRAAVGDKVAAAANAKLPDGKLTLADETGDFKGGFILRRGNIEANCTAELLVELK